MCRKILHGEQKQSMKNSLTDLTQLKKLLAQLEQEATKLGLPKARISDIQDMAKVITQVEKQRAK